MANCSVNGVIWNTCDNRPIVQIENAEKCLTVAGVGAGSLLLSGNIATGLTPETLVSAMQRGILVDKACLPKIEMTALDLATFAGTANTAGNDNVDKWVLGQISQGDCNCYRGTN